MLKTTISNTLKEMAESFDGNKEISKTVTIYLTNGNTLDINPIKDVVTVEDDCIVISGSETTQKVKKNIFKVKETYIVPNDAIATIGFSTRIPPWVK